MSSAAPIIPGSISTDSLCTKVLWKIERFFEHSKDGKFGCISPDFQFRGQCFRLALYPRSSEHKFLIFLMRKGPALVDPNQTVRCHFGLQHSDIFIRGKAFTRGSKKTDWRSHTISDEIPRSVLEKEMETLLSHGSLTLSCRLSVAGSMTTKEACTRAEADDNVLTTLSQNLKGLYVNKKHCDVTIKVQDQTFSAHRAILGARTPVLEATFSQNMAEAETGVICVEDCDPKAFEVFLMFVYSGTVDNLSRENVIPVYYIADKYVVPELKKECVRYMMSNLTIDTFCDVLSVATRHGDRILLEGAIEFFLRNAKEICLMPQWERFKEENATHAN